MGPLLFSADCQIRPVKTGVQAEMETQLEAIEEKGNSSETEKYRYIGWDLFKSEVQIPSTTTSAFTKWARLWHDLTPDEREVYNDRARKIKEMGQKKILASERKRSKRFGRPVTAAMQFRTEYMSGRLKEASKELKREWAELRDEDRAVYVKQFQENLKIYIAQKEEYRSGDKYAENQRNKNVLTRKIREIEEGMNNPQFLGRRSPFHLFTVEKKGFRVQEMWRELPEDEKMGYKDKWKKLKTVWEAEVAEWEKLNKGNPNMTELKAYKRMLEGINRIHKA